MTYETMMQGDYKIKDPSDPMYIFLEKTRNDIIDDLSRAFKEQNDLSELSDDELIEAWKRHGIHAGTWDWDEIGIIEE